MMMFISVILPMLTIILMSYGLTRNLVRDLMVRETEKLFLESKRNLTFYFDDINRASLFPYHNQMVEKNLYTFIKADYDEESEGFFLDTMSNMKSMEDEIDQIYMYVKEMDRSFLLRGYMLSNRQTKDTAPELLDIGDHEVALLSLRPTDDYSMVHIMRMEGTVVSFVRNLYGIPGNEFIGQVVIDINDRIFDHLMGSLYDPSVERLHLVNLRDKKIIYSSEDSLVGTLIEEQFLNHSLQEISDGNHNFPWNAEGFEGVNVVDTIEEAYMELLLIKQIPSEVIYKDLNEILIVILLLVIAGGILLVVNGTLNSYLITRPIHSLVKTIRSIREGDMHDKAQVTSDDEFGELQEHFNEMMTSINNHIDVEYRLTIENTRNELKALQSQINSHFLNNVLQSIGLVSLKGDNKKTYRLIAMLGNMMQYSMRHHKPIVTIDDELKYCISYLELQKNRYRSKFEYEIIKDDGIEGISVPKMILQPIVENCFIHGFKEKVEGGRIVLSVVREDEQIIVSVKDNGKGISEEKVRKLNVYLESEGYTDEVSIGLGNIAKRLSLYYMNQASMKIAGSPGEGVEVVIVLPLGLNDITKEV